MNYDALLDLVDHDPIEHHEDGTRCHYCGCSEHDGPYDDRVYVHWSTCAWMKAKAWLHHRTDQHRCYAPPANDPPCPICGWQDNHNEELPDRYGPESTGTRTDHLEHQARDAGYNTVNAWLDSRKRGLADWLPAFTSERGGVRFMPAPHIIHEYKHDPGVQQPIEGVTIPPVVIIDDQPPIDVVEMKWNQNLLTVSYELLGRNREWDRPLNEEPT